jgi:hypothetical protein
MKQRLGIANACWTGRRRDLCLTARADERGLDLQGTGEAAAHWLSLTAEGNCVQSQPSLAEYLQSRSATDAAVMSKSVVLWRRGQ